MSNLILVRGLPGSGKSTVALEFVKLGYKHFEADHYFIKDGVYKFDGSKIGDAHRWCQAQVKNSLEDGHNVVVSNTFTLKWEMQPYLDFQKDIFFNLYIMKATSNYKDTHGCPEEMKLKMKTRWEPV